MAVQTFNIPWTHAKRFAIKFKTDIDSEYTGNEQRNAEQENPRYKWSLSVPKNPVNFRALCDFFIARKARWQAFYFYWDPAKEGDGQTYLVRFDHPDDELVFTGDDTSWLIPIVQVINP